MSDMDIDYAPYCFSCSRCTDHVGEHHGLLFAGLVRYDAQTRSVLKTELWTRELATRVNEAEYQFVYASTDEQVMEVRADLDAAIDAAHSSQARFESIDWSACDELFKKGMSLTLGEDVTGFAERNAGPNEARHALTWPAYL